MRCNKCGHENNDDAKYCENCGAPLEASDYERYFVEKKLRRIRLNIISNRILLIVSFVTLMLVFISIFLPTLVKQTTSETIELGGMAWFSKIGWDYLNNGQLAIGPFILTFILYFLNIIVTFTFGALALSSVIKSLRRREGFKATQYIILIFVSNFIYNAIFLSFYYEYYAINNGYYETAQASGYYLLEFARMVFFVPFIVHIVMNAIYNFDSTNRIKNILFALSAYFLFTTYGDIFTSSGFTDYSIQEVYIYGLGRYFDPASITSQMPSETAVMVLLCYAFALIALTSSLTSFMVIIHDIYKRDQVNSTKCLILGSAQFVGTTGLVISSFLLAENMNLVPQISNVHIDLNYALLLLELYAVAFFVISIVFYIIDRRNAHPYYY